MLLFPWMLDHFGVSNIAADGGIPDTVRFSFWAGGAALFAAVLWTVLTTREYSPEEMAAFGAGQPEAAGSQPLVYSPRGPFWLALGGAGLAGYLYLVMACFGTLALLLAFGLLAGPDGGYDFATIRAGTVSPGFAALVLALIEGHDALDSYSHAVAGPARLPAQARIGKLLALLIW